MPETTEEECSEERRLFAELSHALSGLVEIQGSHMQALALGNNQQASRFEEETRVALWNWQHARHAYMQHVSDHGCRSGKDLI